MINSEIREFLAEWYPDAVLLDNPSFDDSIKGVSSDGNVIYSLDGMAVELALEDHISFDEALEFIDYNTIRNIPYMPDPKPIVMVYSVEDICVTQSNLNNND